MSHTDPAASRDAPSTSDRDLQEWFLGRWAGIADALAAHLKDSACRRLISDMLGLTVFASRAFLRAATRAADEDVLGAKLPSDLRCAPAELKTDFAQADQFTSLLLRPESLGPSFLLGQEYTRSLDSLAVH
ncbi:hypothetical protein [Streptomyces aureocirculatus]|uniref:hypothetical protein n=1 Tax=Streptomyces aureocirculatus TaxID=67275 RepID=UPI0004C63998|nr:hypothetical protein [Streptomyces aureocirculatus]